MIGNYVVRICLAVGLACSVGPYAVADLMHTDVNGTSVWFTNISEGSPTGDSLPLYSQPFASGDQLVFTPTAAFSAVSSSGGPADQTDGKLSFVIESKPGASIAQLDFEEVGLAILNAPFGGDAFASVLAFADIKVLEINGTPVVSPATTHFMNFSPDSSFLHSADATGPSFATNWAGLLSVTMPDDVTKLLVTVDNHLYASTVGTGTGSLIDKKTFVISVTPDGSVIPEPSTMALFALCAIGYAGRRR